MRYRSIAGNGEIWLRLRAWQDRIRDPMLTVLLALELCAELVVGPLAARRLPTARAVTDALVLALLAIVVLLSHRLGAIISIALGLAAIIASLAFGAQWRPIAATLLRRGGNIIAFSALAWSVTRSMR